MLRFRFEGFRRGEAVNGVVFARTDRGAHARLRKRHITVDCLEPLRAERIRAREWLAFSQGMASLLATGVPLREAGDLWLAEGKNQALWRRVFAEVTAGVPLADALASQTQPPGMLIALLRMGEATGKLDSAFEQAAQTLEEQQKLQNALWSALAYPLVVLFVAGIAMVVLFTYVLPIFSDLYQRYQTELPWLTSQLMAGLALLQAWGWLLALSCVACALAFRQLHKQERWLLMWHRCLLRLPVLGPHLVAYQQIVFCQSMGRLLSAGIGILEAIHITLPSLANRVWRERLATCRDRIEHGASPTRCFAEAGVLQPKLAHMAILGEEAGRLAPALLDLGRLEKAGLDRRLGTHISLLEPFLIVSMALVIGTVLVALYLPMFDIVNLME